MKSLKSLKNSMYRPAKLEFKEEYVGIEKVPAYALNNSIKREIEEDKKRWGR